MTEKQRKAIERHGRELLALFPNAAETDPVTLCKQLRRIETAAHRHFELMCSDSDYYHEHSDPDGGEDLKADRFAARANKLLGSDRVWVNHDPRGYALKVDLRQPKLKSFYDGQAWWAGPEDTPWVEPRPCFDEKWEAMQWARERYHERLHTDWGGYGIIAPEIGPDGL